MAYRSVSITNIGDNSMGWDIDVREKIYLRLANEIFFRIYMENMHREKNSPLTRNSQKKQDVAQKLSEKAIRELQQQGVVENLRVDMLLLLIAPK